DAGMATALKQTRSGSLAGAVEAKVKATHDILTQQIDEITAAVSGGDLSKIKKDTADAAFDATSALAQAAQPQEDGLIGVRIAGFQGKAHRVEIGLVISILAVAYLAIGFYLATTSPLRRMVEALD